jgi:hypothetical protein
MGRTKWSEIRKMAAPETLEVAAQKKDTLKAALELRELAREGDLTQGGARGATGAGTGKRFSSARPL